MDETSKEGLREQKTHYKKATTASSSTQGTILLALLALGGVAIAVKALWDPIKAHIDRFNKMVGEK